MRTGGADTVTDIWVNAEGREDSWVMSGHSARIVDAEEGLVLLKKHEGQWPELVQVGYVINIPALENMEGYLYESASGAVEPAGALAMEEGLGIPVQSHLPVPYPTSIVTVQPNQ